MGVSEYEGVSIQSLGNVISHLSLVIDPLPLLQGTPTVAFRVTNGGLNHADS
jgi:hypothetical protein